MAATIVSQVWASLSSSTITLLTVATALCLVALVSWLRSSLNRPGPWGVPLLGYYPYLLKKDFYKQLHELTKTYGEVFFINLTGQTFVYLDSLRAIREAHVTKADCFPWRSSKHSILQYGFKNGVLFLEGEEWRVQRRLFVQSMRDVGLGPNRNELKGPVGEAIHSTLDTLYKSKGKPVDLTDLLLKECTSVVAKLILGRNVSDEDVAKINEAYYKMLLPMGDINILLTGNIAKYLVLPFIRGYSEFLEGTNEMVALLYKIVNDHKANFDPDQEPQDYIEHYFKERAIRERRGDPQAKYFTDLALVSNLVQAYGDGSVSIGVFLASYLRDLSEHKDVQEQIHEEIVNVVGTERLPAWEDRAALHLTNSTIKELLRISKFFPTLPGLECIKETSILGVKIPKGCVTLLNVWSVHHNPNVFENPDVFDATRFRSDKSKAEHILNFGIGKRACAGENLVMTEVFLFLSAICQNFVLVPATDEQTMQDENVTPHEHQLKCWIKPIPRPDGKYGGTLVSK